MIIFTVYKGYNNVLEDVMLELLMYNWVTYPLDCTLTQG